MGHHHDDLCCPCPKKHHKHHKHHKKERCFKVTEICCPKKKCCPEPVCCPPVFAPGLFGPGGVGFWVFLLILALLGIAWAQMGIVPPA